MSERAYGTTGVEVTITYRGIDDDGTGFKAHRADGLARRMGDPLEPEPRATRVVIVAPVYPVPGNLDNAAIRAVQAVIGGDTTEEAIALAEKYQVVVESFRHINDRSVVLGGEGGR